MTEEEKQVATGEAVDDTNADYLDTIKKLKENSVDRSLYEKLRTENKKLLDSIINGTPGEATKVEEVKASTEDLRKEYLKEDQTNLEFITNTLKLRESIIQNGGPDPFLPVGQQIAPSDDDIAKAQHVAEVLQECVEIADGDSGIFTNELQRRLIEVRPR